MRMIGAHITEQEITALDAIAQAHRVSRAVTIRWAITQFLLHPVPPVANILDLSPDQSNQPGTVLDRTVVR